MADYTLIDASDLAVILSSYDLGPVAGFQHLSGGQANSSFRVDTACGRFVLSICDEKETADVERLARLLNFLAGRGFPTTPVIADVNGRLAGIYRCRPFIIKAYVAGRPPEEMQPEMLSPLGLRIAELHGMKPPLDLPPRFAYGLETFDDVIDSRAVHGYRRWLEGKRKYLEEAIAPLVPGLPRSLIHGDIFSDNTLYQGRDLAAVIDFEEACWYYSIFDLGMCAVGTCVRKGTLDPAHTEALVEGYQRLRPLGPAERELLQAFVVYGAVATSFWRFRQYNLLLPGHPAAGSHAPMDRIADQVQAMPPADFRAAVGL